MPNCRVCLEPQYCDCICSVCLDAREALVRPKADEESEIKTIPGTRSFERQNWRDKGYDD